MTIILPGYSEHNREWAQEIKSQMNLGHEVLIHEWRHWGHDKSLSLSFSEETKKILQEIGGEKTNIIAKSVGVHITLNLIPKIFPQVNKVILCGIASVADKSRKDLLRAVLDKIPAENILCIQNENDKFVTFAEAERFYHSVEPKLKVISKPRADHNYLYPGDFQDFLKS